ncbi:MAG TPA: BA14K family protein [Rhizobiaceae bacterium]|nr:BA14K family protein [Rhizobiaceae bacterium]
MKKVLTGVCAATLAAAFAMPLNAAPMFIPEAPSAPSLLHNAQFSVEIRDREYRRDRRDRREMRRDWRENRRDWREARRDERRMYRGYRGYRDWRSGYRRHSDGFWYPAAAFIAGAIITGAITSQSRSSGSAHVDWCYDRYRSYRASDNTFQPYNGPRQQCYSPYR